MTNPTSRDIHDRATVVVDHCHRPIGEDINLMRAGGVTAKVYQVTLDVDIEAGYGPSRDRSENWLNLATGHLEATLRQIDGIEGCVLACSVKDIRNAKDRNQVAILLGTEGTRWLEGSLEPLRLFHRLGLRELQLTWAYPNAVVPDGRLSKFGKSVVDECHRLGIIVDLTHVPREAFFDVVEVAAQPLIISHGSAKSLTTDLDDEQIRALAETGGLVGIHFYTTYLGANPQPIDVVKQVDHITDLVGIDAVALGVDFFPTQGAWRNLQIAQGTTDLKWAIDDMSQMPKITEALFGQGYTESQIRKVLGENFIRVCEGVFGEQ